MFPAQTSLIPVQIALARFLEQGGFSSIFSNYPYWYEGTTPFRNLTGPILPSVLVFLHRLLPNFSLFEITLVLTGISWVIGAVGVYLLVRELGGMSFWAALLYLFGPIVPFLFRFGDGIYLIALSFIPFVLLFYLKLIEKWSRKLAVLLVITISFEILLDSLIIPTLFLGMAIVLLTAVGWEKIEGRVKQFFVIFTVPLLIATFWYGPFYWLTLLGAPSFAGNGLIFVISSIAKLLPMVLAFVLAIFSLNFLKKKDKVLTFAFYWLFIFGFLTLMRFISNPDFWLDWSGYGTELQFGMAIILVIVLRKLSAIGYLLFAAYLLLFAFIFNVYVLRTFQKDIKQTVEYRIGKELESVVKPGEKVFLSGTTAFWLNAFFDVEQVRGGRDQVAAGNNWRKMVWEVREGENVEDSLKWMKTLNISYLVVHTNESKEYYHDFSSSWKFTDSESLKKIYHNNGDMIYFFGKN